MCEGKSLAAAVHPLQCTLMFFVFLKADVLYRRCWWIVLIVDLLAETVSAHMDGSLIMTPIH